MKKAMAIIGIGAFALGAACAIGKLVYNKVKSNNGDEETDLTLDMSTSDAADNTKDDSKKSSVGSDSTENNDYPRVTIAK
ncbi:hypothetical protein [Lactobacillus sp. LL6]|uniref:hypothetical protein n=1 Tax=Lactobacillus sp. LL6 TaxID=2596827 RepID=UPI00118578C7|nr:hypothetical protein [Lactobacillus sp. LL6]TSO25487.1 hypothetical protein FOD82_09705 [Lactobacillus sp. LL6]